MSLRLGALLVFFPILTLLGACLPRRGENPNLPDVLNFQGNVWHDENFNGIRENDEPGVDRVRVFLVDTAGNVIDTDTTDASHYVLETTLERAGYQIEFEAPVGYQFTLEGIGDETRDSDVNPETGRTRAIDPNSEQFAQENQFRNDAGLIDLIETPAPTNSPIPTETQSPESFMPSKGVHQLSASFSNGTSGCGMISSFTVPFEAEIDREKLTLRLLLEGITYTGAIDPDGTFIVTDETGQETYEGKFSQDWSGEAINSLTEAGCTTTWNVVFTPND